MRSAEITTSKSEAATSKQGLVIRLNMDISSLVKAVIAGFDNASKLVKRIHDGGTTGQSGQELDNVLRDLQESLALGPVIVRGTYDHDFKRFGEPYACGDAQARESMKDVLINLKSLVDDLKSVLLGDAELDYHAIQSASDDCRVNAGVSLGQLSQRLSEAAKAQAMYPSNGAYGRNLMPPTSPSLQYSSSRSTQSSTFSRTVVPRTPDSGGDHFDYPDPRTSPGRRGTQKTTILASPYQRRNPRDTVVRVAEPQLSFPVPPTRPQVLEDDDGVSLRRPSSHTLGTEDNLLVSPEPDATPPRVSPLPSEHDVDRKSFVSSENSHGSTPRITSLEVPINRDRFDANDFSPVAERTVSRPQGYNGANTANQGQSVESYASRAQTSTPGGLEHVMYLQQHARSPLSFVEDTPAQLGTPATYSAFPANGARGISPIPPRHPGHNVSAPQAQVYEAPHAPQRVSSRSSSQPQHPRAPPPPPPQQPLPRIPVLGPLPPMRVDSLPIRPPSATSMQTTSTSILLPSPQPTGPSQSNLSLFLTAPTSAQTQTTPSLTPTPRPNANPDNTPIVPLTLPTEKDLKQFCKSSFRLQSGLSSKAFSVANRPQGIYGGLNSFWACKDCAFEGPLATHVNTDGDGGKKKNKAKVEKTFDPKVRIGGENGGVRYKWVFLAKCHVPLKSVPLGVLNDGSFGGFGCVFCTAEGVGRGWAETLRDQQETLAEALAKENREGLGQGEAASVKSGKSGNNGVGGGNTTPIFGNVDSFMEHLQRHRQPEWWPGVEMRGRMKCVVGRKTVEGEEWDVNLLPL